MQADLDADAGAPAGVLLLLLLLLRTIMLMIVLTAVHTPHHRYCTICLQVQDFVATPKSVTGSRKGHQARSINVT